MHRTLSISCRCIQQVLQATGIRSHQAFAWTCSWRRRSRTPVSPYHGKAAAAQSFPHLSSGSCGHIAIPQVTRLHHARYCTPNMVGDKHASAAMALVQAEAKWPS